MIVATPAPKPRYPQLAVLPYLYAVTLAVLAVVQLMGVGGFDFAHIAYQTPGLPGITILIAGLEIFALPFLLHLPLSALARFFSALFALVAPLFILVNMLYLAAENMMTANLLIVAASVALVTIGITSFFTLDGPRALRFPKS